MALPPPEQLRPRLLVLGLCVVAAAGLLALLSFADLGNNLVYYYDDAGRRDSLFDSPSASPSAAASPVLPSASPVPLPPSTLPPVLRLSPHEEQPDAGRGDGGD